MTTNRNEPDYTEDHDEQPRCPELEPEGSGSDDDESYQSNSSGPDGSGVPVQRAGEVRAYPEDSAGPRDAQARVVLEDAQFLSASWTGLLPHPSDFGAYDRVLPGTAERLLRVLESETVDRSKRADILANAEIASATIDRRWAGAFLLLFTTLSVIFFALGNPIAGGLFLTPPLLGLVKVMWPGRGPGALPVGEAAPASTGDEGQP